MNARVSIVSPRLDGKPWGGRRLDQFGLDLPPGPVGEALVTAGDAVATGGFGVGRTLDDLVASDPQGLAGDVALAAVSGKPIFPLLVKLIDASQNLSIQVHPNDEAAVTLGKLGKTEAWQVLASTAEGRLYVGLQPGVEFEDFTRLAAQLDGSSASAMRVLPAEVGETLLIPAGTIHALGAGVIVYEIQQPSDVTFRLDDWGRLDAAGKPRETHLDAGFAASRPALAPSPIPQLPLQMETGRRELLTACRYFALARIHLAPYEGQLVGWPSSPAVVTLLEGNLTVGSQQLEAGQSAVIWAGTPVELTAGNPSVALVAWVPDLAIDIVDIALASGATAEDILALAGDTDDLATIPAFL